MAQRAVLVCSALLAGLALWGCGGRPAEPAASAHVPKPGPESLAVPAGRAAREPATAVTKEALGPERDQDPQADPADLASLAEGSAAFGFRLLRELANGQPGNVCVSPYSLEMAFGMLTGGARGKTLEHVRSVLGFQVPQERLHAALNRVDLTLRGYDPPVVLRSANGAWVAHGYEVVPDFAALVAREYGARAGRLPADCDPAEINDWVSERTAGRISPLIPPDALDQDTRLVLVNALYLLASWEFPFEPTLTRSEAFRTPSGRVSAQTMRMTAAVPYAEGALAGARCQVVSLRYASSQLAMWVFLPAEGTIPLASEGWDAAPVLKLLSTAKPSLVAICLPKWDLSTSGRLKAPLCRMGLEEEFADGADFTGLVVGARPWIADVYHATSVTVDENGTEAAAATAIENEESADGAPPRPVAFRADHPFLYLVRDGKTGQVLFLGRVSDPTQGAK